MEACQDGRERWNHLNAIPIADPHERWIGSNAPCAADGLLQLEEGLETERRERLVGAPYPTSRFSR